LPRRNLFDGTACAHAYRHFTASFMQVL
jgi:hypothetical protein